MKYEQTKPYGGETYFSFWLVAEPSYLMAYGEEFLVTLSCHFHLAKYPFDSHVCQLYFADRRSNSSDLKFNNITVSYNMNIISKGGEHVIFDYSPLPFEFQLKSLAAKEKYVAKYNVSYIGMQLRIKRNSLGLLLSGYYYPSTSFALFSMVSFIINPDVVSQFLNLLPISFEVFRWQ